MAKPCEVILVLSGRSIQPTEKMSSQSETTSQGKTWRFPCRDLPTAKTPGCVLLGAGSFGLLFMAVWMAGPLWLGIEMLLNRNLAGLSLIGFGMFGMGSFFYTLRFWLLGLAMVRNRTRARVELRNNVLHVYEDFTKFSLLNFRWKLRVDDIETFRLSEDFSFEDGPKKNAMPGFVDRILKQGGMSMLAKSKSNGRKRPVALLYPNEVLQPFADDLIETIALENRLAGNPVLSLQSNISSSRATLPSPTISNRIPLSTEPEDEAKLVLPTDSSIIIHEKEDGQVAYEIPPQGFKAVKGFGLFTLVWTSISLTMWFAILASLIANFDWEQLYCLAFISLFAGAGIGFCVFCVYAAKQKTLIGVVGEQLSIQRTSIFGVKWEEFEKDQIHYIEVGPSGTEVNGVQVMELQIQRHIGKHKSFLSVLSEPELEFLAADLNERFQLREALEAAKKLGNVWRSKLDLGTAEDLGSMKVPKQVRVLTSTDDRLDLEVRGTGMLSCLLGIAFGCVFVVIGFVIMFANNFEAVTIAFGTILSVVGLGFVVASVVSSLWRYSIQATTKELTCTRYWFGTTRNHWDAADINAIDIETNGWKSNSEDVYSLLVDGEPTKKFLYGVKTPTLAYLAGQLNRVVPAKAAEG